MKKMNLKALPICAEKLTRDEMKKVLGGKFAGGITVTLSCYCNCNSGLGTQPSFTTTQTNFDPYAIYQPGAASCQCSTLYYAAQPGYNGGTCSRVMSA